MGSGNSRGNFVPGTGWECLAVDGGGSVQAAELMVDPRSGARCAIRDTRAAGDECYYWTVTVIGEARPGGGRAHRRCWRGAVPGGAGARRLCGEPERAVLNG